MHILLKITNEIENSKVSANLSSICCNILWTDISQKVTVRNHIRFYSKEHFNFFKHYTSWRYIFKKTINILYFNVQKRTNVTGNKRDLPISKKQLYYSSKVWRKYKHYSSRSVATMTLNAVERRKYSANIVWAI